MLFMQDRAGKKTLFRKTQGEMKNERYDGNLFSDIKNCRGETSL